MEAKIIHDWETFLREVDNLESPNFYINLDNGKEGNVLHIYAETDDTILIFEPNDIDLRKWKSKLDDMGVDYKWGESPVKIIRHE